MSFLSPTASFGVCEKEEEGGSPCPLPSYYNFLFACNSL